MPEVIKKADPIHPFSFSSSWRTSMALMEVFRDRPAPAFAFLLALITWIAAAYRQIWPDLADPTASGACLFPDVLFNPHADEWRRYLLHPLWPLEPGYIRSGFSAAALLLEGYTLEHEVGTLHFAAVFLGLHIAASAVLLYFRLVICHVSLEPALAALAVVMHRVNPKVHTDGLDKSIQVEFTVEPRWHLWVLQSLLLLMTENFPAGLVAHGAGVAVGLAMALRDPEVWVEGWRAASARTFRAGAVVHVALLLFALVFMPLTASAVPGDLPEALFDGRLLQRSYWKASCPGSPALLHLALLGQMSAESLFLCKLVISFAFPLLLTPFRLWSKFYAGACLLLAMYAMNSPVWKYPHAGFLVLLYLVWAFWTLPGSSPPDKEHRA